MKTILAFLALASSFAQAANYSFFVNASSHNVPTAYDWTNTTGSFVLTVPTKARGADQQMCVVNGSLDQIAINADWGDNKSSPPSGGTYAATGGEIPLGAGLSVCFRNFGPYLMLRDMTGSALSAGYVYGYSR